MLLREKVKVAEIESYFKYSKLRCSITSLRNLQIANSMWPWFDLVASVSTLFAKVEEKLCTFA
jgi:hypothetical protein